MAKRTYQDAQKELTDRIIAIIESGDIPPWRRPWSLDPNCGVPKNIVTKKPYRGTNILSLECSRLQFDFTNRWWGTYKQWQSKKCQVRKGQKGTHIVYWGIYDKKVTDDDGKETKKKIFLFRPAVVFNLEQVEIPEGALEDFIIATEDEQVVPTNIEDPIFDKARIVVAASEVEISHGGNQAFYRVPQPIGSWPNHTSGDNITVPQVAQFASAADYFGTLFHELSHASEVRLGHAEEVNKEYAFNELRAEMAAYYLSQQCEIPLGQIDGNHESYIANWLTRMKSDPTFLFQASKQAQAACQYFLVKAKLDEEEPEDELEDEASAA